MGNKLKLALSANKALGIIFLVLCAFSICLEVATWALQVSPHKQAKEITFDDFKVNYLPKGNDYQLVVETDGLFVEGFLSPKDKLTEPKELTPIFFFKIKSIHQFNNDLQLAKEANHFAISSNVLYEAKPTMYLNANIYLSYVIIPITAVLGILFIFLVVINISRQKRLH